jgi:hypothetical protein
MNRFGFRILNHGERETPFRYGGRRQPIPPHGAIEVDFPEWYDAIEAVNRLHEVMLLLTASFRCGPNIFDFEIVPNEFGYRVYSDSEGVFDIQLIDPHPDRICLPGGAFLTTNGSLAP